VIVERRGRKVIVVDGLRDLESAPILEALRKTRSVAGTPAR
jgi:hypothetical protein